MALGLYAPFLIALLVVCLRKGVAGTPVVILALFNALGLIGLTGAVDPFYQVDRLYLGLMTGMSILTALAAICYAVRTSERKYTLVRDGLEVIPLNAFTIGLYLFSLLLTVLYYRAVGHITLLDSLSSRNSYDAATARLDSYAGQTYFAPGYVNQFKNAILPALTFCFIHRLWVLKRPGRLILSLPLAAVAVVAVAGTGQRGALVLFMLSVVIALRAGNYLKGRYLTLAALAAFSLFSFTTYLNGRYAKDFENSAGLAAKARVFLKAFTDRVLDQQAQSGLAGFRFTYGQPIARGKEWADDVLGILPGYRGSNLSNQIFASVYGSDRGTMPPSNWGGAYYNFGLVGSIVSALLILLAFYVISVSLYSIRGKVSVQLNSMQAAGLAGLAVALGGWVAGGPLAILNQGAFAYFFVYLAGNAMQNRDKVDAVNGKLRRIGHKRNVRSAARGQGTPL